MMHHIHHVPGRLRVRTQALKKNEVRAQQTTASLRRLPSVTSAEANPLTGSVTIHYDRTAIDLDALLQVLREHCGLQVETLPKATAAASTPAVRASRSRNQDAHARLVNTVARSAALFLLEKAIEQSVLALLASLL